MTQAPLKFEPRAQNVPNLYLTSSQLGRRGSLSRWRVGAITGAIWGGGWRENAGKTATARALMATAWVRAPSMERMGSLTALRASHRLARSLRCEPRLWQRPQSARAEADLTRLGWQCGQRCSLCAAAQRSRLVFSGPLHGCLGCQGARTHAPAISRGAVAGVVPFSSRAHGAPPDERDRHL